MKLKIFGALLLVALLSVGVSTKTYAWGHNGRGFYHARVWAPRVAISIPVPAPVAVVGGYGGYNSGYCAPSYYGGYYAQAPVYRGYNNYGPHYNRGYDRGYDRGNAYRGGGYNRGYGHRR